MKLRIFLMTLNPIVPQLNQMMSSYVLLQKMILGHLCFITEFCPEEYQQYVIKKKENATVVPPADDENSREIFGLIKKLKIVSDQKKKPKQLSFFESVLK